MPGSCLASTTGALRAWFSSGAAHDDTRSPAALERERWLLRTPGFGPLFSRWLAVPAVFVVQICLGSFYSTSVFNKWADAHAWGGMPGSNARGFVACIAFYGFGTTILGNWIARRGVFEAVARVLVLMPLGWACLSVATRSGSLPALLLGYGGLHGTACALAYISTTSCLQAWFPEQKGFMSGLAVCGTGVGSYVWTMAARSLMDPAGAGLEPPAVQLLFAGIFALILALALPVLRNPPPGFEPPPLDERGALLRAGSAAVARVQAAVQHAGSTLAATLLPARAHTELQRMRAAMSAPPFTLAPDRQYTFLEAASTLEFRLCAVIVFGSSVTGAVLLSSAADMAQNLYGGDAQHAALVTSYLNLVNFTGRFGWGLVTDVIGRRTFFLASTAAQTIALVLMASVAIPGGSYELWLMNFLLIGSLYGGGFGVLPALLSDLFGGAISAATHGCMVGMWALSVLICVPIFSAVTASHSGTPPGSPPGTPPVPLPAAYVLNATWLAALPAMAFAATLALPVRREDRLMRRRLGGLLLRGPCGRLLSLRCVVMAPEQQRAEYAVDAAQCAPMAAQSGAVSREGCFASDSVGSSGGEASVGPEDAGQGSAWASRGRAAGGDGEVA